MSLKVKLEGCTVDARCASSADPGLNSARHNVAHSSDEPMSESLNDAREG